MAIHGLKPIAHARFASAIGRQIEPLPYAPQYPTVSGSRRLRSAIASLRVRVCKPTAYAVRRLLGRWRRTRHALGREPHARLEAARVHHAAGGAADAWPLAARAAIPPRRSRIGRSHESLAADRGPRGHSPVQQFAGMGGRGPHPGMLVGVSGSDVHDHQARQGNATIGVGRQRSSQSAAPMPAGILGRLWRVSLLDLGFKEAMSASASALDRCAHTGVGR